MAGVRDEHWTKRAASSLLVLVAIAIGARMAYGLLVPLLPIAGVLLGLIVIYGVILRGRH